MQGVFFVSAALCLFYVLVAKRRFDVATVAALSAALYIFPAFVGYVQGRAWLPVIEFSSTAYSAYALFFFSITACAITSDIAVLGRVEYENFYKRESRFVPFLWTALSIVFVGYFLDNAGFYFHGTKRDLMDSNEVATNLFFVIATVTLVICFQRRDRGFYWVLAAVVAAVTLLLGRRAPVALALLAAALIYLRPKGRISLALKYPGLLFVGVPFLLVAGMVAKPIYGLARAGKIGEIGTLISDVGWADFLYRGGEFFRVQYIFAAIEKAQFSTDGGHIIRSILSLVPIPRSWYTTPSSEFNDLFQPALFPDVPGGMAYNPFAEFYAAAGVVGIFILPLVYYAILMMVNFFVLRTRTAGLTVFWTLTAALVAFYFHRNSMAVSFGMIRNFLWPMLFVGVCSASMYLLLTPNGNIYLWLIAKAVRGELTNSDYDDDKSCSCRCKGSQRRA